MKDFKELLGKGKEVRGSKITLKSIENLGSCSHHSGEAELLEGKVVITFPEYDFIRLKVFIENREDENPFSGEYDDVTRILKVLRYDVSVKNGSSVDDITEDNSLYPIVLPLLEKYFDAVDWI